MNSKTKKQNKNTDVYGDNALDEVEGLCFDLAFNNESATPFKGVAKLIEDVEGIIPGVVSVNGKSKSSFSRSSAIISMACKWLPIRTMNWLLREKGGLEITR